MFCRVCCLAGGLLLALVGSGMAIPGSAWAQQVGSYVIVLEDASIISGNETVEEVSRGMALKVRGSRPGDWLWVTHHKNGWIQGKHVIPLSAALDYLAAEIAQRPQYAPLYNDRATVLFEIGDYAGAVRNYTQAIRLFPESFPLHANRAVAYFELGEYGRAIEDLNEVVRLRPDEAQSYVDRGWTKYHAEQYDEALADYEHALQLDPNVLAALVNLAWLRATCPDDRYRDGQQALELAQRVCEATENKEPFGLATLAAAQAELGNFDEAIKTQEQALELASYMRKAPYRERLAFFTAGRPYRLGAPAPPASAKKATSGATPKTANPLKETPNQASGNPALGNHPTPEVATPVEQKPAPAPLSGGEKSVLAPAKKPVVKE